MSLESNLIFKMAVFWVVALCSLVQVYHCFRGTCCPHHQGDPASIFGLMMEAASTSDTSVNFYQTTWHYNPEDSHLLLAAMRTSNPNKSHLAF
jgi:hypothetical protein